MTKITFIMEPETGNYLKIMHKCNATITERLHCVALSKENRIMSVSMYVNEDNREKYMELLNTMPHKTIRNPIRKNMGVMYEKIHKMWISEYCLIGSL